MKNPSGKDTYYPKFLVIRPGADPSKAQVVDPTTCFTLIPDHDDHARVALKAYCDSCDSEMPGLAKALRNHFNIC